MGRIKHVTGRILRGSLMQGYLRIYKQNVHRLIALTFLGPHNDLVVNHKNGIKIDNRVENLVTIRENTMHAINTGLRKTSGHQLRVIQLDFNNNIIATFDSIADASRSTGAGTGHICQVCKGERNGAGGFKWRYAE